MRVLSKSQIIAIIFFIYQILKREVFHIFIRSFPLKKIRNIQNIIYVKTKTVLMSLYLCNFFLLSVVAVCSNVRIGFNFSITTSVNDFPCFLQAKNKYFT